jgi:hypothetical protein
MRDHELVFERDKPPALARTVARSALDDLKGWFNGEKEPQQPQNLNVSHEKPEVPVTRKDYGQLRTLVATPVSQSLDEVRAGKPDRFKFMAISQRLTPAASALQILAGSKRDPKNQANLLAALPDIQAAQTGLQVLGDVMAAQKLWVDAFLTAMSVIDDAIALPVMDAEAGKDSTDPPPADAVEKRDHDLMVATLKPAIQKLAGTTAGDPYLQWDPLTFTDGAEVLTALNGFSLAKLAPAKAAVERGLQAIKTYSSDLDKSIADIRAKLEAAEQKIAQSARSYSDADSRNPDSPNYVAPGEL